MAETFPEQPKRYLLRLYNADRAAHAEALVKSLGEALRAQSPGEFRMEIIDVLEEPERALEQGVFATPTLVKELPLPLRQVIGDLSDTRRVLISLGLLEQEQK